MPIWRAILLLLAFTGFFSCKKEDLHLASNSTYHKTTKEVLTPIRVFAKSGEIRIGTIVNRFRDDDSSWISQLSNFLGELDTITIVNDREAKLFESSRYRNFFYITNGQDVRFSSKDTFSFTNGIEIYTRTLKYHIGSYKPAVFNEHLISSTAGFYTFGYSARKEFYLSENNGQLKAPWMIYINHSPTHFAVERIQNKLNPHFYQALGEKDTLVLQEYSVIYEE